MAMLERPDLSFTSLSMRSQQSRTTSWRRAGSPKSSLRVMTTGLTRRQPHAKAGAAPEPLARDGAPVRLDDFSGDGQAQARALLLGREKGVEERPPHLLRDALARVVDPDLDPPRARGRDAQRQLAPARHRLASVANQVEQRLPDLRLVEAHVGRPLGPLEGDAHPRPLELGPHEAQDV